MQVKLKEYQEKLMEGVKKVLESDNFKDFMNFTTRFRKYSFGNTLLIWNQKPGANYVAGFKTWNSLGRKVKKGEKGIVIFAPVVKKTKKGPKDSSAGNDSNELIDEKETAELKQVLIGFRAVYVWDVSQTEGEPLPQLETGEIRPGEVDPASLFEEILASSPVPVEVKDLEGNKRGVYLIKEKRIIVSSGLTPAEKCKTLLHELAHHMALSMEPKGEVSLNDRSAHEVLAEGAAYLACSHFGIDSSGYSFTYLASWEQDYRKILSFGDAVRRLAFRIIDMIERHEEATTNESAA